MNPPKMPIHIGDYKRDTGHLRAAGHGAYLLLMFHYWSTGELPNDDNQLAAIACMTRGEWLKHKPVLQRFFKEGWKHGRIDADLEAAKASYERRSEAGKRGGNAKASNRQCSSNATAGLQLPYTFNLDKEKKDAAIAATTPLVSDPKVELFRRGKQVLGANAGGLINKLLAAKDGSIPLARAALEIAATRADARDYIGAICRKRDPVPGQASTYVDPRL